MCEAQGMFCLFEMTSRLHETVEAELWYQKCRETLVLMHRIPDESPSTLRSMNAVLDAGLNLQMTC